jgi:hypothetical protein
MSDQTSEPVLERYLVMWRENTTSEWRPDMEYSSGSEAAELAKQLNSKWKSEGYTSRARVVKVMRGIKTWQDREQWRLDTGKYRPVPWAGKGPSQHYCHLSTDKPGHVAYTPDSTWGDKDRQRRVRASAYIIQFLGGAAPKETLDAWARACGDEPPKFEVLFAASEDDIERVYTLGNGGPTNSCMAHPASSFKGCYHPCRVYAAGDLQVAYTATGPLDDDDTTITARVLVWPEKKQFGRFYGYPDKTAPLKEWLQAQGYSYGEMEGAKLLRVAYYRRFYLPYLDGCNTVTDRGPYLQISTNGEFEGSRTDGLSEEGGPICPCCEERCSEEDMIYIDARGESICDSCYSDSDYRPCQHCAEIHSEGSEVHGLGWTCDGCLKQHYILCDDCGEWYQSDDIAGSTSDGESICDRCYSNGDYWRCDECGEIFTSRDTQHQRGQYEFVCDGCHDPEKDDGDAYVPAPRIEDAGQTELPLASHAGD